MEVTSLVRVFAVIFLTAYTACERKHYYGDKVIRITPRTEGQLKIIRQWLEQNPTLDVWRNSATVGKFLDVHIKKDDVTKVKTMLQNHGIDFKITIEDLEKKISNEKKNKNAYGFWPWSKFSYEEYNRYYEIVNQLRKVAAKFTATSKLLEFRYKTTLGIRVYGLKIKETQSSKVKPGILLDGGMDGRDWITSATLVYLTKILLEEREPTIRAKITKVLKHYDIYIYPVVNPDGYDYSHTNDRMWRKTRSQQAYGCKGVNMNRNFGAGFANYDLDKEDPCSGTYPGAKAYSEDEVNNVALEMNILKERKGCIAYWNLHSSGQQIKYPYGYRKPSTWYDKELNRVASAFANGASKRYGTKYTAGRAADLEEPFGGQAIDWAYDKGGVTYAFAPHLRPGNNDDNSFIIPESEIKPTAYEFADGFLDAMIAIIDG